MQLIHCSFGCTIEIYRLYNVDSPGNLAAYRFPKPYFSWSRLLPNVPGPPAQI